MNDEIFRKKSIDKIKSPESLNDYIQVTNPSVWLLLISIIALLIGALVWGIWGHMDSTIPATVQINNGTAICYISEENFSSVQVGQMVKISDGEAEIVTIEKRNDQELACELKINSNLNDGIYEAKVVTESIKPLSFIFN